MRLYPQLVIDAGAGHVAAAIFAPGAGGRLVLEDFALETTPADPSLDAGWVARTGESLARFSAGRKFRGPAVLAVPGHITLTKFITTPAVMPSLREQVIRFEAAQSLPLPLETVAWDHLVVADGDEDTEVMLTAVKLDVLENLCAAVEAPGFSVKRVASSCHALCQAFRFNYPDVTGPVLVMDVGARSTNVLVIGPAGRFFARTLLLGGNAITAAVAEELQVDFAAAEKLKIEAVQHHSGRDFGSPAWAAVERSAVTFAGRLQQEVMRTVGSFGWRTGTPPPVALYLTGGGANLPGLESVLVESLKMPVRHYDGQRNLELSANARAAGAAEAGHFLPNLVGLAASQPREVGSTSGLLPPGIRAARTFRRRQRALLCAGALLVFALLAPIWHFRHLAEADQARAAALRAQLPSLQAIAQQNETSLARLAATSRQIDATRRVLEARSSWIEFLGDLESRLASVGDVWLDRLTVVSPPATRIEVTDRKLPSPPVGQLRVGGRLFDAGKPLGKVGQAAYARLQALLASLTGSPFISTIADEHFDNSQPGILRFDFTLTVDPQHPL